MKHAIFMLFYSAACLFFTSFMCFFFWHEGKWAGASFFFALSLINAAMFSAWLGIAKKAQEDGKP